MGFAVMNSSTGCICSTIYSFTGLYPAVTFCLCVVMAIWLFFLVFPRSNYLTDTVIINPQLHKATSCLSSCWMVEASAFPSTCTASTPRLMVTTGRPTWSLRQRSTPFPRRPTLSRREIIPLRTEALQLQRLSDT